MATINMRDFPQDLHRALRIRAAEEGTSIKAVIIRYCEEGLKREGKQIKKKRGK